jgi:hypothetical protein
VSSTTESIPFAPGVEFIPLGRLDDGDDATSPDWARSKARWQALPEGWLSATDTRDALMRVAQIPDYDRAAGEALLASMDDFLEVRVSASGRGREYRRREVLPEPMSPAARMEAEAGRLAEVERERFERELHAREALHAERDRVVLDENRRLWNELCAETVTPRIEALERRIAELSREAPTPEGQLEAVGAMSTPTATASEAPAESIRARARRFMFGDADEAEIERLLQEEDETTDN